MTNIVKVDFRLEERDGEPRVFDLDLARALGFRNPNMIRKLINRHMNTLSELGSILSTVENNNGGRGRRGKAFFLNEKQTAYICTKSETPRAIEQTIAIIEVFTAWRNGHLANVPEVPRNFSEALRLAAEQAEKLEEALPKAAVADRIANSDGLLCFTDAAKTLGVRPLAFRRFLEAQGYIYKRPGNSAWIAKQQYIQQGLFDHKSHIYTKDADGLEYTATRALVTPKGMAKFAGMLNLEEAA